MLGALARYAANRAVHSATDNVVRRLSWSVIAGLFLIIGIVTLAIVTFWWLEQFWSRQSAALAIIVGSFALAVIAAMMPSIVEWMQKPAPPAPTDGVSEAVNSVVEEAKEVADYLGPMRLVASSFMVGLGVGRRVKGKS